VETEQTMSEANVRIIRRRSEIRDGKGGKRRKVGMDDRSLEPKDSVGFHPSR
jgi:hypothetical protein